MDVILNGFGDAREIENVRKSLAAEHDVNVRYDGADMSKQADIEAMMAKALREFGVIDVLVNNAGIQHIAPVEKRQSGSKEALSRIYRCDRSMVCIEKYRLSRL